MTKSKLVLLFLLVMPMALRAAQSNSGITQDNQISWNEKLLNAARFGNEKAVNDAIKNCDNVNCVGPFQFTPLHYACEFGWTEIVKALLLAKAIVDVRNQDSWTPLHIAAKHGRTEDVKVLLLAKATIDMRLLANIEGQWTALHIAAWNCHTDTANAFLEAGANFTLKNSLGENTEAIIRISWKEVKQRQIMLETLKLHKALRAEGLKLIPQILLDHHKFSLPLGKIIAQYCYGFAEQWDKSVGGDQNDKE